MLFFSGGGVGSHGTSAATTGAATFAGSAGVDGWSSRTSDDQTPMAFASGAQVVPGLSKIRLATGSERASNISPVAVRPLGVFSMRTCTDHPASGAGLVATAREKRLFAAFPSAHAAGCSSTIWGGSVVSKNGSSPRMAGFRPIRHEELGDLT